MPRPSTQSNDGPLRTHVRRTKESLLEHAHNIKSLSVAARDFEGGQLVGCFGAGFCVKFPRDCIPVFLGGAPECCPGLFVLHD